MDPKFIVAIGASAGGLEALNHLFDKIKDKTDMCFIIVQHLSMEHKSLMPELLQKVTKIPIIEVNKNHVLKRNHIYLINNHTTLSIEKNMIIVKEKLAGKNKLSYPINILFKSLAETYKEKAIGIILSGTGSDGTEGLRHISNNKGISIVQHPDSAKFNGMPFSAIQTNEIDFVSNIEDLPQILEFISTEGLNSNNVNGFKVLDNIINLVSAKTEINFHFYKTQTLYRRILKMMELQNFNSIEKYFYHLNNHSGEIHQLANSFLIGVTSFFRDNDEWQFVKSTIVPDIIKEKDIIRIWSLGCSTGQEAYTIAILVLEELEKQNISKEIKIFATDLNEKAVQYASEGTYLSKEIETLPTHYLDKYFIKNGDNYTVKENIRSIITFVKHDILETPPFLNIDLITCRNLLIYLKKEYQFKILNTIKFSLNKGGYLFLGPSEKNFSDKFLKELDIKKKFFKLSEDFKAIDMDHKHRFDNQKIIFNRKPINKPSNNIYQHDDLEKKLIQFFCEPLIVFDLDENITYSTRETGKFLNFPQKELVLKEVFEFEVYIDIIRELKKVKKDGNSRKLKNISFEHVTADLRSDLIIRKFLTNKADELYIIEFKPDNQVKKDEILEQDNTIQNLKDEIKSLHLELKNARKKLESINENYQINNEELMSSNEELQSSNEELQSVNEELYTVNQEYKEKLTEISVLNNDFFNLFRSAGIASLYLDNDMKIRRIAPNASDFFGIENEDLGRSILQFNTFFEIDVSLYQSIDNSVKANKIQEQEISDKDGKKYLLRVSPCRDKNNNPDGIILSFIPISDFNPTKRLISKNNKLDEALRKQTIVLEGLGYSTWHWESKSKKLIVEHQEFDVSTLANFPDFFLEYYKSSIINKYKTTLNDKLEDCLKYGKEFNLTIPLLDRTIEFKCYPSHDGHTIIGLYGTCKDITEQFKQNLNLTRLSQTYLELMDLGHFGTISIPNIKKEEIAFNDTLINWLKVDSSKFDCTIENLFQLVHQDDKHLLFDLLKANKKTFDIIIRVSNLKNENLFLRLAGRIKKVNNINSLLCIVLDITDNKALEFQWNETVNLAEKTAQTLAVQNEQLESYTYIASHNIRSPLSNLLALMELYHNEEESIEKEKYITLFEKALAQLEKTVNNLTDAIKVQQKTSLERTEINIKDELMKVLDILSGNMKKHGVLISLDIERGLNFKYPEEYLKSIFLNLLSNAIKYRSEERLPKILVEAYLDKNSIIITIEDNGIGIDLKKFGQRIFGMNQTFHKNEDARGLGLFLTKTQIEATGGTINVDSKIDQGTKFTIQIPKEK
ncbi:CheR family methyltransferase [Flammeovirga pacifica]|uniref:Protein-glutamate O-methyltransferase n=1 Tax=Flammeovirga pacifica TaxID=915059 RepID=A0A1S1YYQ7_FLAPC|nr:CheR family methyltransferase [Flammeovirga pacifica]OHX66146.1 hypothetical protein NH26_07175 [Flammeovirga pacifica]